MEVEKLDNYGRGIIHINNKICFVENALPTENVEIELINTKKKFQEAYAKKIENKSSMRIKPKCKYYHLCGGCHLMHMNEESQRQFKTQKVKEIIQKFIPEKIKIEPLEGNDFLYYRNKIVLHVRHNKLGFYQQKSNELVEIDSCLLVHPKINELIFLLKEYIKVETAVTKITIKLGNDTNELMLILEGKVNNYLSLLDKVTVLIINNKVVSKKDYITSIIGTKKYTIRKDSFFQVNRYVTKLLYDEILKNIKELNSKNVLDLYCGSGTIGIYICDYVSNVVGIEVVEDAIKDANNNKKLNKVQNIQFLLGRVEDEITKVKGNFDTIIIDPPRTGLNKVSIDLIKKIKPKNIIYVSCDVVTLSRDLTRFNDSYDINYIKPFDMFPNTYHVECVSVLTIK